MAQPFLPPPPSSTKRRNRHASTESPTVVQHRPHIAAEPSTGSDKAASRLVDFDNPALVASASSDEQTWTSHPSGQPSLVASPTACTQLAVSQQMPTDSPSEYQLGAMPGPVGSSQSQLYSAGQVSIGQFPLQPHPSFPTVDTTLFSTSPVEQSPQPALFADFGQQQSTQQPPVDTSLFSTRPVEQSSQPALFADFGQQQSTQQPPVDTALFSNSPVEQSPQPALFADFGQQQSTQQPPVDTALFSTRPVEQSSQPALFADFGQQQPTQQPPVDTALFSAHPVEQSPQLALFADFSQQQVAQQPQVDEQDSNEPDDIDFQIQQMEQELAQLSAFSAEYESADYEDVVPEFRFVGTQEQKVDQGPQTGIYDLPIIPPPPARTRTSESLFDPFNIGTNQEQQQQQQQQQPSILFDFDSAFSIGTAGSLSRAPYPPQATASAGPEGEPPLSEGQYADPSQVRRQKTKQKQGSAGVNPPNSKRVTHKALHNFMARHDDELDLNKGDPVNVEVTAPDGWCTGTNIKTGRRGIFPESCVLSISHPSSKASGGPKLHRFPVKFLGTVPLKTYKGMKYLSAAITKVVGARQAGDAPPPLLQVLEVCNDGLRVYFTNQGVIDSSKPPNYFPLEKVTYVGAHPRYSKFFGFICESPSRAGIFVCSVFVYGSDSKPICEAISGAFKKLKGAYLDHTSPTYDFYVE